MNLLKISRKYHRYLMLLLGIQFVIWTVSGAYMVIFDIDYIHGDSLIQNHQSKINPEKINYPLTSLTQDSLAEGALTQNSLIKDYPNAQQLTLGMFIDREVYRFKQGDIQFMVDANTGQQLSPLDEAAATAMAKYEYTGSGQVLVAELITDNPPFELSRRYLPAWRVNFDDFGSPSLYISAQTGLLVTKRHEFWRTFDLMFSLHVMDYEDEDPSNWLLFWVVLFSLIAAILGLILTYYRIFKKEPLHADNSLIKEAN